MITKFFTGIFNIPVKPGKCRLRFRAAVEFPALIFIGSLTCFSISCKKSTYPSPAEDYSYFPLASGKYIIYDVDSIGYSNFDLAHPVDTSYYQIREEVDSPFVDNEGNSAFKIIRSKRKDENSPWTITDIWSASLSENTAERVEENLRYIKLDFPVLNGKQWYGNIHIQTDGSLSFLDGWRYEYSAIHQPLDLNSHSYDSTITVTQQSDSNAIQQYIYIEKYANHVGMIYKYEDSLSTQPGQPKNGRVVTMKAKEFN
jgi:hypothetical protein